MTPIAIPQALLFAIYWCAAVVVLAEALNKLHRIDPFRKGISRTQRARAALNALGWMLFAVASAGVLVSPVISVFTARLQDAALMLGLAVFVLHRRLKEVGQEFFEGESAGRREIKNE